MELRIPPEFAERIKPGLTPRQIYNRVRYLRRMSTPEGRAYLQRQDKAKYERKRSRLLQSEEGRRQLAEENRRKYEQRRATPEGRAKLLAKQKRYEASSKGKAVKARYDALRRASLAARQLGKVSAQSCRELEALRTGLLQDKVYAAAHALVPRTLPAFLRDDIISDLCLGVLAGDFLLEEMPAHLKGITTRNRKDSGNTARSRSTQRASTTVGGRSTI